MNNYTFIEAVHPTEREAVEKYLRKRDRLKTAEINQKNKQVNEEQLKNESRKIIENLHDVDINTDKERDRQAEILKQELLSRPVHKCIVWTITLTF